MKIYEGDVRILSDTAQILNNTTTYEEEIIFL